MFRDGSWGSFSRGRRADGSYSTGNASQRLSYFGGSLRAVTAAVNQNSVRLVPVN